MGASRRTRIARTTVSRLLRFGGERNRREPGGLAPIFPLNPSNRAEAKRRFGVDFFPAATMELGSGQPFLRFFQADREGRERGVLSVELRARR
jgi:hypothetical protein